MWKEEGGGGVGESRGRERKGGGMFLMKTISVGQACDEGREGGVGGGGG